MALEVQCAVCGETLNEPGAIILSPPDEEDRAIKEHLCVKDYEVVKLFISALATPYPTSTP